MKIQIMICFFGCKCRLFFGKNHKRGLLRVKYSAIEETLFGAGVFFLPVSNWGDCFWKHFENFLATSDYRTSEKLFAHS